MLAGGQGAYDKTWTMNIGITSKLLAFVYATKPYSYNNIHILACTFPSLSPSHYTNCFL